MFFKIGVLKNFAIFTRKYQCWSLFLIKIAVLQACNFIKKMFSCEYCKNFKNTFFEKHLEVPASEIQWKCFLIMIYHSELVNGKHISGTFY